MSRDKRFCILAQHLFSIQKILVLQSMFQFKQNVLFFQKYREFNFDGRLNNFLLERKNFKEDNYISFFMIVLCNFNVKTHSLHTDKQKIQQLRTTVYNKLLKFFVMSYNYSKRCKISVINYGNPCIIYAMTDYIKNSK